MEWTRAHEAERQRILELLQEEVRPFDDMSDGAQDARRGQPFLAWCRTYLPHYFDAPYAPLHRRMMDAVGEPGMPTFVSAFRGAGKSVLLSLARPLYRTVRREVPFWLYGSQVQRLAAQSMDYVRLELAHNQRLACDYPGLTVDGDEAAWVVDLGREAGRRSGHYALTSSKFEAFGIGMSPRGRRHVQYRPLEFVGDDLEDAELARNPRREQNLWDWLMDEVVPALEPEQFCLTVVGTIFGPGCLMERARKLSEERDEQGRPLARYVRFPARNDAGASVWPERFSDEALGRIRATIGLRNWLRNFALVATDPGKAFQASWIDAARYRRKELDVRELDVVAFLDPAVSETGCPRALIVVGMDRDTGERYVLEADIERVSPTRMVDWLFQVDSRYRPRAIGIEENGGFALIRPLLRREEADRKRRLPVRYVTHTGDKGLRIESLCAGFEQGLWRFPETPSAGIKTLEEQFLAYPDGYVDGPDATAGCDELLPDAWGPVAAGPPYRSLQKRRDVEVLV